MGELINKTKQIGPYPGRTWQQEYDRLKGYEKLFPFMITAKIEEEKCDWCRKPTGPEHQCCSKKCYKALIDEAEQERRAEARCS